MPTIFQRATILFGDECEMRIRPAMSSEFHTVYWYKFCRRMVPAKPYFVKISVPQPHFGNWFVVVEPYAVRPLAALDDRIQPVSQGFIQAWFWGEFCIPPKFWISPAYNFLPKLHFLFYFLFIIYSYLFIVWNAPIWLNDVTKYDVFFVDFKAKNLLTAPICRMLLKYNTRISMGKLNGNKIWVISDYYCVIFFVIFHKSRL